MESNMQKRKMGIQRRGKIIRGFYGKQAVQFDPLTVLCDLICSENEKEAIKTFENIFEDTCFVAGPDYFDVICKLREKLEKGSLFTLNQLERVKSFYQLSFTVDISIFEPLDTTDLHVLVPICFGFCNDDKVFENSDLDDDYVYSCPSMLDVVFAILHYLLCHNFSKFKKCEHCQKFFATQSLKQKYCTRKSPYPGYEKHACEKAVDTIMKRMRCRRKTIYENLYQKHPMRLDEFIEKWHLYGGKEAEKCVDNLKELEKITSKQYADNYWYNK